MNKELKKIITKYLIIYGIIASSLIGFAWYKKYFMVGGTDGICQHYTALKYMSHLFRELGSNICRFDFSVPQYEFNLGMGDDILTTLNYYGLGDPFTLLLAFFSDNALSYAFTVYFYFRLGIAGLIASVYMHEMIKDREDWAYVIGGLLYSFSGFALESNTHVIFIHAMMYLPLLLLSVELNYKNKKHSEGILFWSVCGLALSGFYYLYIIGITTAIYTFYRWFSKYRKEKVAFCQVLIIGLWSVGGIVCASVTLVPELITFLSGSRNTSASSNFTLSVFYSWDEVRRQFYRLFYVTDDARGMASIAVCGLIGIVVVICSKKYVQAKRLLVIALIAYLLPVTDYIMSGARDHIYNRWELILSLLFASVFVLSWNELRNLSNLQIIEISTFFGGLVLIGLADGTITERCYRNSLLGYAAILIVILVLRINIIKNMKMAEVFLPMICIICIALTWAVNATMYPVASEAYGINEFSKNDIDDFDDKYRIDTVDALLFRRLNINQGMLEGYSGTTEYFSMINSGYTKARDNQGLGNSYLVTGMDFRSILSRLSSVKYLIAREGDEQLIPYGYTFCKNIGDGLMLYESESAMPLAYYYDRYIDYEQFNKLTPIEKQYCMTKYAALENYSNLKNEEIDSLFNNKKCTSNIELLSDGTIVCKCNMGENYLVIDNDNILINSVEVDGIAKKYFNSKVKYINLGNHKEGDVVKIKLSSEYRFSEDMFRIETIDISTMESINELSRIDNEKITKVNNGLVIKPTNLSDVCVCISIPYTAGWVAYIDGKETKIYKCNDFYMGINVPSGTNMVELRYETPGLRIGIMLSLLSILIFLVYCIWNRRNEKNAKP